MSVELGDDPDRLSEWRTGYEESGSRSTIGCLAALAFPELLILIYVAATGEWNWLTWSILAFLPVLAALGALSSRWSDPHTVTAIWLEPHADVPTVTMLRDDESRASFPVSSISRIKVERIRELPEQLSMRLWVGSHVEHTRRGDAATAEPLLGVFAETGVPIKTKVIYPD